MRTGMLAAIPGVFLALGVAAFGAAALGSDILAPAVDAISGHMPSDAQDTSGVMDVLDRVGDRLDEIAAGDPGAPADVPTDLPPEEAAVPMEMPDESEAGLEAAESFLETVPL